MGIFSIIWGRGEPSWSPRAGTEAPLLRIERYDPWNAIEVVIVAGQVEAAPAQHGRDILNLVAAGNGYTWGDNHRQSVRATVSHDVEAVVSRDPAHGFSRRNTAA